MNAIPKQAWADGVRAVHQEASGVLSLVVVQPGEVAAVAADAIAGYPEAGRLVKALAQAARGIEAASGTRRPMLCASCPRPLRLGRLAFAVVLPACDDPTNLMVLAVCRRCATAREDVERKAKHALTRLWPDLRKLDVHPIAGRA